MTIILHYFLPWAAAGMWRRKERIHPFLQLTKNHSISPFYYEKCLRLCNRMQLESEEWIHPLFQFTKNIRSRFWAILQPTWIVTTLERKDEILSFCFDISQVMVYGDFLSHHSFSSSIWLFSFEQISSLTLKISRISAADFPLIKTETARQVKSSNGLISI